MSEVLQKNLMSVWHELNEDDKQLIKELVLSHKPKVKPEHLGLVTRMRVVRELQIYALKDYGYDPIGNWARAESIIVKLGGVSVFEPL